MRPSSSSISSSASSSLLATWRSDRITGVFIRLLWKDVQPTATTYNFTVLQRELDAAVKDATRTALTGQSVGPSLFEVVVAIGQKRSVERLKHAAELV